MGFERERKQENSSPAGDSIRAHPVILFEALRFAPHGVRLFEWILDPTHPADPWFSMSLNSLVTRWLCGVCCLAATLTLVNNTRAQDGQTSISFAAQPGPGQGKHVVLISGDEEYRSEEALPQLGKILAKHGFNCTVLFSIQPQTGEIDPTVVDNTPGLEALEKADLMVIATRFRKLPDAQMKWVVDYVEAGKPVIGMRTATHAFNIPGGTTYSKYSWNYKGEDYQQGFGRQVLGETWVAHHGHHKHESTRGIVVPEAASHPILRGIKDGDIWGPTDVYEVRLPLPGDSQPLVLGQVLTGCNPLTHLSRVARTNR